MEALNAAERGNAGMLAELNPGRGAILNWYKKNQRRRADERIDQLMEEVRRNAVEEGRRARGRPLRSIAENEYNSNNNNNHTRMLSRSQKIINTELSLGRLRAISHRKTLKAASKQAEKATRRAAKREAMRMGRGTKRERGTRWRFKNGTRRV
jgi:hypothetical protein